MKRRTNPLSIFASTMRTLFSCSSRFRNCMLDRLVEFVEVGPADRITHRHQNVRAGLDHYPLIDGHIDLTFGLRFVRQNPRRQGGRAIESVRQESQEP